MLTEERKLYIKNMVCPRCIMVVREQLEKLGLKPVSVELGNALLEGEITAEQKEAVRTALEALGFELIDDKRVRLVEQIKNAIVELVHKEDNGIKVTLSAYIVDKLNHDYSYLSKLFSEVEEITIEKYFMLQKIERVKELLTYDELSLSEIANLLNYTSDAHLSTQFKKITGITPSYYKQLEAKKRKSLDKIK